LASVNATPAPKALNKSIAKKTIMLEMPASSPHG